MSDDEIELRLSGLSKGFGSVLVLRDLSLEVHRGEFLTLLGPSGCGKTTTLNLIAGFFSPDAGTIEIAGNDVTARPAHLRNTAMVFQNYALFPHLNVFRNVAFGLRMRHHMSESESRDRVAATLELVKMGGMEKRYPQELSGGQQQRVALARALVLEPALLLLDEPLSNLDANLREEMRVELRSLQRSINITTILVTHDQEEAFAVSDRVAMMHDGRLEQLGSPADIYGSPRTEAVANFIGRMNWLQGKIVEPGVFLAGFGAGISVRMKVKTDSVPGTVGSLMVRPEHINISTTPSNADLELEGQVVSQIYLGPMTHYYIRIGDKTIVCYKPGRSERELDVVFLSWPRHEVRFMPKTDENEAVD